MSFASCTEVSDACPVEATTYGYVPNLGGNAFLCAVFGICTVYQIVVSVHHRAWSFLVALAGGALLETIGYGGRLMMYENVWSSNGFRTQIITLIVAPSFVAAGIYLSLKHIILYLGPECSRLKPRLYTWLFIGFDIFSIVLQAAGGGVAAAASQTNLGLLNTGNNMIIAGISVQVATMSICGVLAADYFIRYRKASKNGTTTMRTDSGYKHGPIINHKKFQIFLGVEIFSYITVLIRCIYRLPEMSGGWGNPLMRIEKEFLILDGMMVALAIIAFTVCHPAFWFPPMTGRWQKQMASMEGSNSPASEELDEMRLRDR